MEVAFEKKNDLQAVVKVNIKKDDYSPKVESELKKTQKKVNVPGFRPGKAPMGMVKKMYGKSIFVDEVTQMANSALYDYLSENKVEYLAQPIMSDSDEAKIDFEKEEDFLFLFELGLAPEVELKISGRNKVTKYVIKVSDEELEKEMDTVLNRYGKQEEVEAAEEKDIIYLICTELDDEGNPLEGGIADKDISTTADLIKNNPLQKKLIGIKKDTTFKGDIFKLFNDNETVISNALGIPKEGVADLNKKFEFTVTDIKRQVPAELNQELFDQVFGEGKASNEAEFKNLLRADLENYYASEADNMFEHELDHVIQEKHDFDLPADFLKKWLIQNNEEFTAENVTEKYEAEARQLRYVLLRNKVLQENEVKIEAQDIEMMSMAYSAQMLRQYGMPNADEQIIRQISENNKKEEGYMNRMQDMVAQRKFMEIAKTKVKADEKEVSVEEFYAIIKKHNEEHNH